MPLGHHEIDAGEGLGPGKFRGREELDARIGEGGAQVGIVPSDDEDAAGRRGMDGEPGPAQVRAARGERELVAAVKVSGRYCELAGRPAGSQDEGLLGEEDAVSLEARRRGERFPAAVEGLEGCEGRRRTRTGAGGHASGRAGAPRPAAILDPEPRHACTPCRAAQGLDAEPSCRRGEPRPARIEAAVREKDYLPGAAACGEPGREGLGHRQLPEARVGRGETPERGDGLAAAGIGSGEGLEAGRAGKGRHRPSRREAVYEPERGPPRRRDARLGPARGVGQVLRTHARRDVDEYGEAGFRCPARRDGRPRCGEDGAECRPDLEGEEEEGTQLRPARPRRPVRDPVPEVVRARGPPPEAAPQEVEDDHGDEGQAEPEEGRRGEGQHRKPSSQSSSLKSRPTSPSVGARAQARPRPAQVRRTEPRKESSSFA